MGRETEEPIEQDHSDLELFDKTQSKSQLKRDSHELQALGKKLTHYNEQQLANIPLNDQLLEALALARKISHKRSALKRQYQFIGKLLRSIDVEPIHKAVAIIEDRDNQSIQAFKKLEYWRDRILSEGDPAIQDYCQQHTLADRQKLRQLHRNYQQKEDSNRKAKFSRLLFREIRDGSR